MSPSPPNDNTKIGLDIDTTHEPDAVWLNIRIRLPRGQILRALIDTLAGGSGYERTIGGDG